ncbi:hypothetical protein CIPAW_13G080900 [Carya illinoinensis]|uniref:Cardiomyopathy-associated protein 5 n=1 Tax=Carya illinoinensis TaxID=32201 RepID=A0A8T1NMX8_CARIL|nr:hypothetical protein CIPAW_13G080900 [Carya illinoinensis]
MGIDVKGVEAWICRILEFSINISYRFIQNHPFVFSVSVSFFLVYIFLPFILNFLAYTSPFIFCIAILLRIFWSSEQSYIRCVKGDGRRKNGMLHKNSGSVEYDIAFNRNDCSYLRRGTSRRRKNREMDEQTGKNEEESYSSKHGASTDDSAAEDIRILDKHLPFLSSEDLESQIKSSDGTPQACQFDVGGTRIEASNMEEADDDDEEETQDNRNSAVKWTEDDQKNLMDLGFSEIERNRRLESLIAKRRARKLFSMQVERGWGGMRGVPSSQISPIFLARNNTIDLSVLDETEGLEFPDTAPSILFPKQNPFDLPYDPLEEKPNLRGDSFHQEFMAAHKETLFCRHESFSLGPSFPLESKQERRGKNFNPFYVAEKKGVLEGSGYYKFYRQTRTGDHDQRMEQLLLHKEDIHGNPDLVETGAEAPNQIINSVEITHEEDKNTKNDPNDIKGEEEMERSHGMESLSSSDESNSLSSSEENEQNFNAYVAGVLEDVESNPAQKSTSCLLVEPENDPFDCSLSANEMNRRGDQRFFAGQCSYHTSNCSIASDLQVEVSEVGSPPLTVDGSNSATDGESLTYDEESEKENTFGSEEMWGASSRRSGIEENEEVSRGTHEVSQGDIVGLELSRANETSEDVVASPINPLKVDDQESTDVSSLSSSTIDISGDSQAWSINIDPKIHDDVKQVVERVLEPKSQFSDYSDPSSFGNLKQTMPLELVPHSYEVYSEKPEIDQDLSYPHKTNVVYDVNHTIDPAISNMEELKMNEDTDDGWQLLNKQEIEKPTEYQAISDSEKPTEENSKPNDDVGGNQVKLTENESIMGMPKPIEAKEYFKLPQESGGERSIVESGACRVNQNSDDPIASTAQQDLVIEEVTINSRPSLSPKSISIQTSRVYQTYDDHNASAEQQELAIQDVLINSSSSSPKSMSIETIPIDQSSSSNANQMIHLDILQSHLEDTAKTSTLDEQPPLNLAPENLESIQESGDEQSVLPRGAFGVNQNDDDPKAPTEQQELATEDVLINSSSSSPKSLFTANISIDQASSSNANQRIYLDILQYHLEDTAKTSTLDEQPHLSLGPENLESVQENGDEQRALPRGAFRVDQNYDDPNASTEQQESSIEDVHINSSSLSPKSVLTGKTPMGQASSNSNPKIHGDILQSQLENTERARTLDEQPPLNLAPENLKSIQENGDVIASGASVIYHNSDDPNASVARKEWVIEEVISNSSSSSSPNSILAENIQIGHASSYPNQNIPMDILQSLLEDITNTNSSDKQQTSNLTPTGPQNAKYAVEDSSTYPSNNRGSENLLEPCNPPEKSTEETSTVDNLNEPKPDDKDGNENSQSYQAIKDGSETWISNTASTGLSKPIEDNNNILGTMEPGKFIAEASTIYKVNDPIVSEKGDNEKQNATPIKSWEEIDDSRTEEETEDSRKLHEHDTIIHLPKSGDTTCNWEESQKLTECEAVDPSKLAGEKENPDVHAIIVEEDPSNPDLPIKSISES